MQKKKSDDILSNLHEYNIDLSTNEIFLFGEELFASGIGTDAIAEPGVEYVMSNRFIRNIVLCNKINPGKPLLIHMKTCGGEWEEGMAIYDAIKAFPSPVTILSYTHARSMSSLILQAANKRVLMPNSYFMFHDGTLTVDGTVKSVNSYVEFAENATDTMIKIYFESMVRKGLMAGEPFRNISKWLRSQMDRKEEVYLTAKQAVDYGLADEVFDFNWQTLTLQEVTNGTRT